MTQSAYDVVIVGAGIVGAACAYEFARHRMRVAVLDGDVVGSGATAAAVTYNVAVSATVNGAAQSVSPMVVSQVQSVTIDSSTQQLDLNTTSGTVPLSSVVSIL